MTLPTSGPLSMSQINGEFSRGTNLNAYRGTDYYTSSGGPFVFPATPISFNNFYGTQVNSPVPPYTVSISGVPNIAGVVNGTAQPGIPSFCLINFLSDGTYTIQATTYSFPPGTWATPTTAGLGNYYWIRFTQTGAAGTAGNLTGVLNTWLSVGATRQWKFEMPPFLGARPYGGDRTFTIDIALDSAGLNIIATKTGFVMSAGIL